MLSVGAGLCSALSASPNPGWGGQGRPPLRMVVDAVYRPNRPTGLGVYRPLIRHGLWPCHLPPKGKAGVFLRFIVHRFHFRGQIWQFCAYCTVIMLKIQQFSNFLFRLRRIIMGIVKKFAISVGELRA